MGLAEFKAVLVDTWTEVSGGSLYFAAAVGVAICATWLLLSWRNADVISTLRTRLKRAEAEISGFRDEFGDASPKQVAARLKRLEAYVATLPPRRLNDDQKRVIAAAPCPPARAPYLTVLHDASSAEINRYARDFVEAFCAAAGWNVIDEPHPKIQHRPSLGIAVGVADRANPTPTERIVMTVLREADVAYDLQPRSSHGAGAEIVVGAR
jgi:hypothetical protein